MEKRRLQISGMSCEHCVARVAKIISSFKGVSDIKVDLKKKEATFDYEAATANLQDIIKAIGEAGYQATEI